MLLLFVFCLFVCLLLLLLFFGGCSGCSFKGRILTDDTSNLCNGWFWNLEKYKNYLVEVEVTVAHRLRCLSSFEALSAAIITANP